jgi:hypothetical protein
MDPELETGQGLPEGTLGVLPGGTARKQWARGRRAAPAPDYAGLPAKLTALVRQRFPFLNRMFNALPDARRRGDCLYDTATLVWMVVPGFLCRQGSRNGMDAIRNTGQMPANLLALSGQRRWPAGRPATAPCTQTVTRLLDTLDPLVPGNILVMANQALIRDKLFDKTRLAGRVLIVVDGTKEESCRRLTAPWRRKYRYVLHAKIIGPAGTILTVMAEPCDHYDTERGKLDCERAAFQRLAGRLKAAFPKQPILIIADALFACEPVFAACEQFGWKYIFTFKEGSHPAVWAETIALLHLAPGQVVRLTRRDLFARATGAERVPERHARRRSRNFLQDTRWVCDVPFAKRMGNVVFQGEVHDTTLFFCAWVTNLPIHSGERACAIAAAGRGRSRIEESYNVQKNGGFGLEHAFRETDRGAANYHLLMQLAHNLWQLLFKGWLRRELEQCRKMTGTALAKLLQTALHACAPPVEPLLAFQLRFESG